MSRLSVMLVALVVLASGCATRSSVRHVQSDVSSLRSEVGLLRQSNEQISRESAQSLTELKALQARLRDFTTAAAQASGEVAKLSSQLNETTEAVKRLQGELTARPAISVVTPPPVPPLQPVMPVPSVRDQARSVQAETAYATALATFRAREHGQAVLEFLDFIARYPRHPLVSNAQYWIGEAYYAQHDYRQAVIEFQKVLAYPDVNGKVADALLMMGMCYTQLREPARASETWRRIISEYPSSSAATRARTLLATRRVSSFGQ